VTRERQEFADKKLASFRRENRSSSMETNSELRLRERGPTMNLNQRVFWGFHTTMGCVYTGVIGSELAGWYAARDAIFLSGVAIFGSVLLIHWVLRSNGRRWALRHESPGAMQNPYVSVVVANRLIAARRAGSFGHLQRTQSRQRGLETETQPD
jgi:hypothetical protein